MSANKPSVFPCQRTNVPSTFAEALGWVREDAKRKGVKLTQREIDAEVAAVRQRTARGKKKTIRPMKGKILIESKSIVDQGIVESMAEYATGHAFGPFASHQEFLAALRKESKKQRPKKPKRHR